jgi:N-acetylglutamate synthase/N-acetylornithine aminotransferase
MSSSSSWRDGRLASEVGGAAARTEAQLKFFLKMHVKIQICKSQNDENSKFKKILKNTKIKKTVKTDGGTGAARAHAPPRRRP